MLRFSMAGIPVTIHGSFLLTAAVLGLAGTQGEDAAVVGAAWVVVVLLSVMVHETGHALMFKLFGRQPVIELHGMGGTTATPNQQALTPMRDLAVSLAGPGAGLLLGTVCVLWQAFMPLEGTGAVVQRDLIWANVGWSIFNLLPVLPLDGGAVVAALVRKFNGNRPPRAAYLVSVVTGGALAALCVAYQQYYPALLMGLFTWQNVQHLRVLGTVQAAGPHPAVAQALQALQAGQLEDAMRLADKVLRGSNRVEDQAVALHVMAGAYIRGGRPDDALKLLQNLPQGMHPSPMTLGDAWMGAGNKLKALQYYRDAFRSQPGRETARRLMGALLQNGLADEGRAMLSSEGSLTFTDEMCAGLAEALFVGGLFEEALKVHAFRFNKWRSMGAAYNAACACVKLNRPDDGLTWLKAAVDQGFVDRSHLETDPDLEPLRGTADWQQLLARVNAPRARPDAPA